MKKKSCSNISSFNLKVIGFSIFIAAAILIAIIVYFNQTQTYPKKTAATSKVSIKGNAFVIDGDSIMISSITIRLLGIDAPELHQFCGKKDSRYPCGLEAKKHLKQLIANHPVTCHLYKNDQYHRILATCKTKKVSNINATLVRNGWAVSYYDYPEEEKEARKKKKGIWQSYFQRPREWRRAHSQTE
ncbi:endonuclease YncB(thermonuclease family) [Bartonella callosciuri]|uniref:Endonuclease YncB(Thermonuclease family) n=1 Tax=Bartonella callosciuri TaxID=686223 RepID=A0A840NUU0_9HYPH|nr:thermonuclease family protein [Bartonella callosciuri]MBB5073039.1 endonuclease YncB(thermonuclease family) [Bartonella callosciuri]